MGKQYVKFYLNSIERIPSEWKDIDVELLYDDTEYDNFRNETQPKILLDEFTFTNEAAREIMQWVIDFPFQGMPFYFEVFDSQDASRGALRIMGFLDFVEHYEVISINEVKVKIKYEDSIDLMDLRLKAVSFGYLAREDGGIIGPDDYTNVPVIIKKKYDAIDVAFLAFASYVVYNQINKEVQGGKGSIADLYKTIISTPTQKAAEIFQYVAKIVLAVAGKVLEYLAIYPMIKALKEYFIPQKSVYKGILFRKALTKACDHLGLTFESNIPELDYYVYLPSKTDNKIRNNKKDEGIPNISDYGYQLDEFFDLCEKMFTAKRALIDGKVLFYPEKDPIWRTLNNYQLPSVLKEVEGFHSQPYKYNLDEMYSNYIISFQYDPTDEWTLPAGNEGKDYFKGTNCQVITDLVSPGDLKKKLTRGLKEINLPVALGARRDKLTAGEIAAGVFFRGTVDKYLLAIGQKPVSEKIKEYRGYLQISSPSFNIPKVIALKDGLIPVNDRHLLSASKLFSEYHWWRSFKRNPLVAQKRIYTDYDIPFDYEDYSQVIKSGYFSTEAGDYGKFRQMKWRFAEDTAKVTYEVSGQYIDPNLLKETVIEA